MTILIVDDNKRFRLTVYKFILSITDNIIECNNGSEAVEFYDKYQPDYVLMDIKMPVMNGLTATKNIIKQFPDARIIVITDYDNSTTRQAALKEGAIAFFSKENLLEVRDYIKEFNKELSPKKI